VTAVLQSESAQQQQLERGIQQVFAAGQGCLTLTVIGPKVAPVLVAAVMDGDAFAKAVLHAADRLLRKIQRRSRGNALTCLLCDDNVLWREEPPGAVGVLTPFGVVPVHLAVGLAYCEHCAAEHGEAALGHATVALFRNTVMPDLRVLPVMAEAGHA
jgi:hypothetical protein